MSDRSMTSAAIRVGFFGKLPSRGDFVRAALSRTLVDAWDGWLQMLLPAAQERVGESWIDLWHATRPWHFAIPRGLCGGSPVSGVWLASEDRVGRAFPLTIAAECSLHRSVLDAAEDLGRAAIADSMTPDALAQRLDRLPCDGSSEPDDPTVTRWWRRNDFEPDAIRCDRLPAVDVFIGMLTP